MALRDQWYENAIIYCLDVETYADGNGDGIGDFVGLSQKLDFLASLGITCLWLMPFYPTPNGDDGYDVMDYVSVDPRLGSMADFAEFIIEASERGIRVIIDLIPNHSSDQHRWFQSAKSGPDSPYWDYYVWRHDDPGDTSNQVVFPGEQEGIWSFSEEAGAWYLHHFHAFQPDLNFANPAVRDEFRRVMGLWLQLGVSGFRIDAAPFLINQTDVNGVGGLEAAHQYLEELRYLAQVRRGDAALIGEVDVSLSTLADYFGGGNQLQALFNFPLNRFLFLGLAQESADPIKVGLQELPSIPDRGQWVNFLRHHDELNLARLTQHQRQQILDAFGPNPEHQIYERGLRRRLAPMLDGDIRRLRLAWSALFSLPGAPMIFYGDEIGMGENLELDGRLAVRTPMQWSNRPSGGFSSAPEDQLVRPVVADGEFGYSGVNVVDQRSSPDSMLNWIAALTRVRRECPEIGSGDWSVVETNNDAVLGLRYDSEQVSILTVNNFSGERQKVKLNIRTDEAEQCIDLFVDRAGVAGKQEFRLDGYGYAWMRLERPQAGES